MTQEEKAKRYDEALKVLHKYDGANIMFSQSLKEEMFPELKESEYEKLRKRLIQIFRSYQNPKTHLNPDKWEGLKICDIIDWLEKQGEQKPIMNVPPREVILSIWDLGNEWKELTNGRISTEYGTQLDYIQKHWHESEYYLREKQGEHKPNYCHHEVNLSGCSEEYRKAYYDGWNNCNQQHAQLEAEQKPADKVKHKFKVGDKIVENNEFGMVGGEITDIDDIHYELDGGGRYIPISHQDNYKLVVEQKPTWSEEDELHIRELESLVKRVWAIAEHENDKDTIHEMRDLSFFLKTLKPQLKQEWSKEDESILFCIISDLKFLRDIISKDPKYAVNIIDLEREINWLEFLSPQNNITDEELAQAKKDAYNDALDKIEYHSGEPTFDDGWSAAIWYLKKRNAQPQNTWKPSDEQMKLLREVQQAVLGKDCHNRFVNFMYELKRLREE